MRSGFKSGEEEGGGSAGSYGGKTEEMWQKGHVESASGSEEAWLLLGEDPGSKSNEGTGGSEES